MTGVVETVDVSTLVGRASPRVATRRPRGTSKGGQAIRFARDVLGFELLPWQETALRHGLVWSDGRWASRTVAILVARQNGKTALTAVRALAGMCLFGEREVIAAAQSRNVALEAWTFALELAEAGGLDVTEVRRTNGQEQFAIGNARYMISASNRGSARGLTADLVIVDELREQRIPDGWAALEKTRRAKRSSQVWAITNEGDEGSVVLARLAEQGRTAAADRTPTETAWLEWSAAPDRSRYDPAGWAEANPALGHLILGETIRSEAETDDPMTFETEVLCRQVPTLRPWILGDVWDAAGDTGATVPDGAEVVFSLEAGPELRHATIGVGWRRPDGRVYLEAVDAFVSLDGPVLARASARLSELVEAWRPRAVVAIARSRSEAATLRALERTPAPLLLVSAPELRRAANAFHEATVARQLVHAGDPMVAAHVAAVTAETSEAVMRRRSPGADIDAATALVLARHGTVNAPDPEVVQDWTAY